LAKNVSVSTVTIANGATTSTALTVRTNSKLLAFETPSAFTGTAVTFEASSDSGTTYKPVYDGTTQYSINVGTSRHVAINPTVFEGVRVVRVISGSTEAAARTITLITGE
jgi:hypothetical protein